MDQNEFVDKFWDLIMAVLEEHCEMEVVGMLSFVKESWLHQFFQVMDMHESENEDEVMFR